MYRFVRSFSPKLGIRASSLFASQADSVRALDSKGFKAHFFYQAKKQLLEDQELDGISFVFNRRALSRPLYDFAERYETGEQCRLLKWRVQIVAREAGVHPRCSARIRVDSHVARISEAA